MSSAKQLKELRDAKANELETAYAEAKEYNDRRCKSLTRKIVKDVKKYVNSEDFANDLTDRIKTEMGYAKNKAHLYEQTYTCDFNITFSVSVRDTVCFTFEIEFNLGSTMYYESFETEMRVKEGKHGYKINPSVDWRPLYKSCSKMVVKRLNELGFTIVKVEDQSDTNLDDVIPNWLGGIEFTF